MKFVDDAIVLSGETGTKIKCEVLGGYYPLWWSITSGGPNGKFRLPTSIIEMNAGTCLDHIEGSEDVILGSAGHAMELKIKDTRDTSNLKVVLVEQDDECFEHLTKVVKKRWPALNLKQARADIVSNTTKVYLFKKSPEDALDAIEQVPALGNALFFFDDLLFTAWSEIERVAKRRITNYYRTRTEFIIFLFSSDFFDGRAKSKLSALPDSNDKSKWTDGQRETVQKIDDLFGHKQWRDGLLTSDSRSTRMDMLIGEYRKRLHRWFRYVLPLPFNPKGKQEYHLFMCSNYEAGTRITRDFYSNFTGNAPYSPNSNEMYAKFKSAYPEIRVQYSGQERPLYWKFLRRIIRDHEEGLCDIRCEDFREEDSDWKNRLAALKWLEIHDYITEVPKMTDAWSDVPPLYSLNWKTVTKRLGVYSPPPFVPLRSRE